jgi:hypothetical protein
MPTDCEVELAVEKTHRERASDSLDGEIGRKIEPQPRPQHRRESPWMGPRSICSLVPSKLITNRLVAAESLCQFLLTDAESSTVKMAQGPTGEESRMTISIEKAVLDGPLHQLFDVGWKPYSGIPRSPVPRFLERKLQPERPPILRKSLENRARLLRRECATPRLHARACGRNPRILEPPPK